MERLTEKERIAYWRFKEVIYMFQQINPDEPIMFGIHFIQTDAYYYISQN